MSKISLAIRVAGVVIGIVVLGGGVALATVGNPKPLINPAVSHSPDAGEHSPQDGTNDRQALCPTASPDSENEERVGDREDCDANRGDHETDGHETDGHETDSHGADGNGTDRNETGGNETVKR